MKKLLIKFGTECLLGADGILSQDVFDEIARQLALLMDDGWQVAIVTSGAVQAGREETESLGLSCAGWHRKDFAASGSCRLMRMWTDAFGHHRRCIGQILVTHANLRHRGERLSITDGIRSHLRVGAVPVINENDVVSDREIRTMERISENDQLTVLLSSMIRPNVVISVTSIGGVYDQFPIIADSALYRELDVTNLPANILRTDEKTGAGSGGMSKKVVEFAKCYRKGRRVGIISWNADGILRFVRAEDGGTLLGCHNRL